ncbi:MAG: DUF3568 family protein [Planctomycetota bacterium]|nr:MAG: DUF3568 family protein [Planctomycetota bacterium]
MLVKRMLLIGVFLGLAVGGWGCAPAIIGVDAGVYHMGKLYGVSGRDLNTVYDATLAAMGELELEVKEKAKDVFSAKVVAKSADGKRIKVRIKPGGEGRTKFSIKVGKTGERRRSEVIYEKIRQNLAMGTSK